MQNLVGHFASGSALALEAIAVLTILYGGGEALFDIILAVRGDRRVTRRAIWLHFARWLMLGLEFALAAIRTFLNVFLERDIHNVRGMSVEAIARTDTPLIAVAPQTVSR